MSAKRISRSRSGAPTTTFDEGQPHEHDANGNSVAILATANPIIAIVIARIVQGLTLASGLAAGRYRMNPPGTTPATTSPHVSTLRLRRGRSRIDDFFNVLVGSEGPVPLPIKRQNQYTGEIETIYEHIRGEIAKWARVIKAANVKPE